MIALATHQNNLGVYHNFWEKGWVTKCKLRRNEDSDNVPIDVTMLLKDAGNEGYKVEYPRTTERNYHQRLDFDKVEHKVRGLWTESMGEKLTSIRPSPQSVAKNTMTPYSSQINWKKEEEKEKSMVRMLKVRQSIGLMPWQ